MKDRRLASFRLFVFAALLAFCAGGAAQIPVVGNGGPGPVKAQHLTAELVTLGPAIAPGGQQIVGLVLTMEEHWHVYWTNPGDSGEPPKITWTLPEGIAAAPMKFPIPQRLPLGPMMDFGYEDEVAFPVTISASPSVKDGPAHLDAQVSWLVCAQVCVPGKAHLGLNLNVQSGAPAPANEPKVGALGEAVDRIPKALPPSDRISVRADPHTLELTLIDGYREREAEFYPADNDPAVILNAANQPVDSLRNGMRLYLTRSPDLTTLPSLLKGVVKLSDTEAYQVSAPIVSVAQINVPKASNSPLSGLLGAIGLAFAGGIILNLMPCVFPVLFLKGLALVQGARSGEGERHALRHSLVYALGILLSFWVIVTALLILRVTGDRVGWGFQLQSPVFLALIASLMFFLALSLAGQFDIGLSFTSVGGSLAQKRGYAGSFFTGVLATLVATPCAAPLMGAAIGFALAQSPLVAFAVFTSLAFGLAAPYVALSAQPSWAKLLPKPGPWMEILKQVTALPLFASAIWLTWVYGQLHAAGNGVNQVALLLTCFLVLSIAGWVLGRWPARWSGRIAAALLIALALAIPLSQARKGLGAAHQVTSEAAAPTDSGPLVWLPYSEQALNSARSAGHPVFIDFTAAWCLSCQFNEHTVLDSAEVQHEFRTRGVTLLKADWTNNDPVITQKLSSVGRASVPTYVIYPAAAEGKADVLPEALTKEIVLTAIRRDAK